MKSETIPAGYQLHIDSWENDADNAATEILNGLSSEDVHFYLDLLPLFKSRSQGGFSNRDDIDKEPVIKAVMEKLNAHPKISDQVRKSFLNEKGEVDEDTLTETMSELLGYCEYVDFRVFDGFKVYYVEKPIQNVTKKFEKKRKVLSK